MDELSPRARALLDAANGNDDPAPTDAARVRRAVLVRIGSTGFSAALFTMSVERAKAFLGVALPKLVAVSVLAAGTSSLYQHWKESTQAAPAAAAVVAVKSAPTIALQPAPEAVASFPTLPEPVASVVPAPRRVAVAARETRRDSLEAEMRWVRAADAALRGGDAGLALSLLNQHAREFPNGVLAEEREGLRVVAGCQSGISPSAQRVAARFLEHAPRSLIAGRVRAACAQPNESGG